MSLRVFDLFLAKSPSAATEPSTDWLAISSVLILFSILVLLTQFAPTILEFINRHESKLSNKFLDLPIALRSFSSGLAVAYVLIMLIPEYQIFNEKVAYGWINAYKLSLFGLLAYKGIQHYCLLVANKSSKAMGEWGFVMHLGFSIFGLFEENERHFKRLVPPVVISVLSASLVLTLFNVLSTALLLGCLSVLAGIILYNVFKNELPSAENSSFAWFAIGVFIFVSVDSLTVRSLSH